MANPTTGHPSLDSTTISTARQQTFSTSASTSLYTPSKQRYTNLSFCTPTSLAFAKRLTWEQTPWTSLSGGGRALNPVNIVDATIISTSLSTQLQHPISTSVVQNAILLGTIPTATAPSLHPNTDHPFLYLVFPHNTASWPARDPSFIKVWHDDVVKPAFDNAWLGSGLTTVHGADPGSRGSILPADGEYTDREALPSSGFVQRLINGSGGGVRVAWPAWGDEEGDLDVRAQVYGEAWEGMMGMLKDHPDLGAEYGDPMLVAVWWKEVVVESGTEEREKLARVVSKWERFGDLRFVGDGGLSAVVDGEIVQTGGHARLEADGDDGSRKRKFESTSQDGSQENEPESMRKRRKIEVTQAIMRAEGRYKNGDKDV